MPFKKESFYKKWRRDKIKASEQSYRVTVSDSRVIVKTNPYNDDNYTEVVQLPPQVTEMNDVIYADIIDSELIIRRKDGTSFAWNIKTHAPLGPR